MPILRKMINIAFDIVVEKLSQPQGVEVVLEN